MKKITVICTFILISVFSTGVFICHLYHLKSYKKAFKSFLKETKDLHSQSTIFIYPSELYTNSNNIIWEDENKEIVYRGILYDILEIKSEGRRLAIIAVSDEQEMFLKQEFSELYPSNGFHHCKNPFQLLNHFLNLKTIIYTYDFCFEKVPECKLWIASSERFQLTVVFISQETPPPDFLS